MALDHSVLHFHLHSKGRCARRTNVTMLIIVFNKRMDLIRWVKNRKNETDMSPHSRLFMAIFVIAQLLNC